jgi:hypothetical protein
VRRAGQRPRSVPMPGDGGHRAFGRRQLKARGWRRPGTHYADPSKAAAVNTGLRLEHALPVIARPCAKQARASPSPVLTERSFLGWSAGITFDCLAVIFCAGLVHACKPVRRPRSVPSRALFFPIVASAPGNLRRTDIGMKEAGTDGPQQQQCPQAWQDSRHWSWLLLKALIPTRLEVRLTPAPSLTKATGVHLTEGDFSAAWPI